MCHSGRTALPVGKVWNFHLICFLRALQFRFLNFYPILMEFHILLWKWLVSGLKIPTVERGIFRSKCLVIAAGTDAKPGTRTSREENSLLNHWFWRPSSQSAGRNAIENNQRASIKWRLRGLYEFEASTKTPSIYAFSSVSLSCHYENNFILRDWIFICLIHRVQNSN